VRIFSAIAGGYDFLTGQPIWRAHCAGLARRFHERRGLRVLDLGVGPGVSAIALAGARPDLALVGADTAHQMLRRARRSIGRLGLARRVRLVLADGARLPFADGAFDVVTAHSFLYLVDDRDGVLAETRRVLAPGGRCVFLEPRARAGLAALRPGLRSPRFGLSMLGWRVMSRIKGRFTAETLRQTFERAGFDVVGVEESLYGLGLVVTAVKVTASPRGICTRRCRGFPGSAWR